MGKENAGNSGVPASVPLKFSGKTERAKLLKTLAEPTGFEPATSDVTGRRSNQLNYDSALKQNQKNN